MILNKKSIIFAQTAKKLHKR